MLGTLVNIGEIADPYQMDFRLEKNGDTVQQGNTSDMIFRFEQIISFISQYFTLRTGDLIYTGTPSGVAPVKPGDRLKGFLGTQCLFDTEVR